VRQQLRDVRAKVPQTDTDRSQTAELEAREDIRLPIPVKWDRTAKTADIDIDGTSVHLRQGEWSAWVPLTFRINMLVRVHGMMQFYLVSADKELQLYG